ncbi:KH domain-containing, RNA-binding, signal transduction-associated protein 1-like isoform X2 [Brienomyrus brachyistius]|uniref:KH domain-containing, RNA-binding, signal transduction-associated protein 1-like isoform X2 n=1 Tax=Brienomyrus brachyistius TaxID=42636 RepID=UPI0020B267F4|nr:KH domain-containing, RNA-binding, signal transduction-associated protein 1-like isoform X2 [Brienomyrus brachyistius]
MENESKYLPELLAEKDSLDASFTHATNLISAEIDRIQKGESKQGDNAYLDLFATKNVKLKERVLIPVKQHPKCNFVGKILGPQGNTIKRLQEETGAKISILGKGSMRDKSKEEQLRKSGEAKYAHLSMELHVFVEVSAPVPEAYLRMARALEQVKKFLIPDTKGDLCQEQLVQRGFLNGAQEPVTRVRGTPLIRGRGALLPSSRGRGLPARSGTQRGGASRGPASRPSPAVRGAVAARSRPPGPAQRMLPPPVHTAPPELETYEGYAYEDSYAESTYDHYYSQSAAGEMNFDYGHGETQEPYEAYDLSAAQDDWNGTWAAVPPGKAAAARPAKGSYREHPYGRY